MKDLLQLIKAEIERMSNKEYPCDNAEQNIGYSCALGDIINFLDSIPKEEPASEDLEEEFNRFLDEEEGVPRMWHSDEQMEWAKDIAHHFAEWQKEQFTERANALEKKIKEVENTRLMFVNPKDLMKGFFEALVWGRSGFVFNENTGEVKVLDQEEIDKLTTIEHLKDDISRMFKDYWKSTEETASKEEQP
jgi:hypothetical protein